MPHETNFTLCYKSLQWDLILCSCLCCSTIVACTLWLPSSGQDWECIKTFASPRSVNVNPPSKDRIRKVWLARHGVHRLTCELGGTFHSARSPAMAIGPFTPEGRSSSSLELDVYEHFVFPFQFQLLIKPASRTITFDWQNRRSVDMCHRINCIVRSCKCMYYVVHWSETFRETALARYCAIITKVMHASAPWYGSGLSYKWYRLDITCWYICAHVIPSHWTLVRAFTSPGLHIRIWR